MKKEANEKTRGVCRKTQTSRGPAGPLRLSRRDFIKAGVGSAVLLCPGGGAIFGISKASENGRIRGRVVSGDKPLEGVRCSDGHQVVLTDRHGRFVIDSTGDGGAFVFVVTPQGYWTDQFYVPTAEAIRREVVFDLKAIGQAEQYTAVYMPDIHLGEGNKELSYRRFTATLDELNTLPNRPAFIIFGGDICLQNHQGERHVELTSRLKMPVRNGFGNHEMMWRQADPRRRFHTLFGPTYYSFDYGYVHYVVLDGCLLVPQRTGLNVEGQVSPRELAWLESDLKLVPKDVPIVVAIHIPLVSTYPERHSIQASDRPLAVNRNPDEVINVLKKFNVPLVLQGHLHENERIHIGSIEFVESISVCGSWWQATGRELGVSGEPRGYRVIEVDGTCVSHRYVSSAESRINESGEFIDADDNGLADGSELIVNFFDASNEAKVSGRIDGGSWTPWLPARAHCRLKKVITAAHHWKCPEHLLSPGQHRVEVRCEDRSRADTMLSCSLRIEEKRPLEEKRG